MLMVFLFSAAFLIPAGCDEGRIRDLEEADSSTVDGGTGTDGSVFHDGEVFEPDAEAEIDAQPVEPDGFVPSHCDFDYDNTFIYMNPPSPLPKDAFNTESKESEVFKGGFLESTDLLGSTSDDDIRKESNGRIAHIEPEPEGTFLLPRADTVFKDIGDIVMPEYYDNMPLFERGAEWVDFTRCYETPVGVMLLTEPEAYFLYKDIAELTTGVAMDTTEGVRTVVGIRRAYPGRLLPHDNLPNRFNDTLVLLWRDENGLENVREFPVNTDTGAYDFGYHSSSSLRPNRRYHYVNGWHRSYNALRIDESSYLVRDDSNKNGYWDSDRNGWLPPISPQDHERTGSAHNIHMGSVDAPLGTAAINNWSAGCQVIPGMDNWTEFITHAWTNMGDPVSYFLIDVRDIDHRVFYSCTPDGTHECPYEISGFPYTHSDDTSINGVNVFDLYNCSPADESGPEIVYFFTVDRGGTLSVSVEDNDGDDMDIHLLDADDPNDCRHRAHMSFSTFIDPGRYFIVVDTYVSSGIVLSGPYTLHVDFQ